MYIMKRYLFVIATSLVMASCSQDTAFQDESKEFEEFTGDIMDNHSRTFLNGNQVVWNADDEISIFIKTGYHQRWKVGTGGNTTSAKFSFVSNVENSPTFEDSHYAVYPFNEGNEISDDKIISMDLSSLAIQNYQEGTFENGKSIMAGKSGNTNIPFKNALSLARIELSSVVPGSYSISSVSISSTSVSLNGPAEIDMTQDEFIVRCIGTGVDSYMCNKVQCAQNIVLGEGTMDFYVLLPSGTYPDMTITIQGTNEMDGTPLNWSKELQNITFRRNEIKTFPKELEAVDFSGNLEGV